MRARGFTLVEVLVAMALIAITTVMLGYFITSFRAVKQSQIDSQAQAFANSYFEALRAEWSTPTGFASTTASGVSYTRPSGFSTPTISATDGAPVNGQVVIRTVKMQTTGPNNKVYQFETRIARPTN